MEFSFEYYDWLYEISAQPIWLTFISIFGSLIAVLVLTLFRSILKGIGLGFIVNSSLLDDFIAVLGITGIFGGFIILFFSVPLQFGNNGPINILGIRIVMIWLVLFILFYIFYVSNKATLKKWHSEVIKKIHMENTTMKIKKR